MMQPGTRPHWMVPEGTQMLWQRPDWPAPAGVEAWVTSRSGGCSAAPYNSLNLGSHVGDSRRNVLANRAQLRRSLPPGIRLQWLNQVHGTHAIRVDGAARTLRRRTADAACVSTPGIAAVVLTADCLPVFFSCEHGIVAAAAHAGWRGLLNGVLESTVQTMGVPPERLLVWFGPAIAVCHFEVGEEVRQAFLNKAAASGTTFADTQLAFVAVTERPGKWMMDIYALARARLTGLGVSRVYGGGQCTACDHLDFYSYRRDGVTGRMASLIYLKPR